MTEQEWNACENPMEMVWSLGNRASNRKLQLFACACCRRIGHLLPNEESKEVLKGMERLAENRGTAEELAEVRRIASDHWFGDVPRSNQLAFVAVVEQGDSLGDMVEFAANATAWEKEGTPEAVSKPEERAQACFVRDIFGNPFHLIAINAAWLAWNDGTLPKIAQTIYDDRAFDRLPILADALEEAGCTTADILNHCRQPGEHVRGCWVVDAVPGEE